MTFWACLKRPALLSNVVQYGDYCFHSLSYAALSATGWWATMSQSAGSGATVLLDNRGQISDAYKLSEDFVTPQLE